MQLIKFVHETLTPLHPGRIPEGCCSSAPVGQDLYIVENMLNSESNQERPLYMNSQETGGNYSSLWWF